jgi:hypothetical protein
MGDNAPAVLTVTIAAGVISTWNRVATYLRGRARRGFS